MTNHYYRRAGTVQAERWTGTTDSLIRIQQLLLPGSPLWSSETGREYMPQDLGVYVTSHANYKAAELQFVSKGGWVVRDGTTILVRTNEAFQQEYQTETEGLERAVREVGEALSDPLLGTEADRSLAQGYYGSALDTPPDTPDFR